MMVEIGNMLLFPRVIGQHNLESDFLLDAHTVISGGFKFEGSELFLNIRTLHLLNNMTRAVECGCSTQVHFDRAFNLCTKAFSDIRMGMNSMGAKLNTVSLSLASTNLKSAEMMDQAYESSLPALHLLFQPPPLGPKLCGNPELTFCPMLKEHNTGKWKQFHATDAGKAKKYEVWRPSSNNIDIFLDGRKRNSVLIRRYINMDHI